jgi:hypothetical protein
VNDEQTKEFLAYCITHGINPEQFSNVKVSIDGHGWTATVSATITIPKPRHMIVHKI